MSVFATENPHKGFLGAIRGLFFPLLLLLLHEGVEGQRGVGFSTT